MVFLYLIVATRRGIKKTIPFIIARNTIKYLGISLTKGVRDYFENYDIDEINWRQHQQMHINLAHWLEEIMLK